MEDYERPNLWHQLSTKIEWFQLKMLLLNLSTLLTFNAGNWLVHL